MPWYSLTENEAERLNPPNDVYDDIAFNEAWLPVGVIPRPKTRLGWFVYHLVHGLWMHYSLHKVLGYALANTRPESVDHDDQPCADPGMSSQSWRLSLTADGTICFAGQMIGRVLHQEDDITLIQLGGMEEGE